MWNRYPLPTPPGSSRPGPRPARAALPAQRRTAPRQSAAFAAARALAAVLFAGVLALPAGAQQTAAPEEKKDPDVHYVPTPPEAVAKMLEVTRVGPRDVVYDLGSGDGRIVVAAARDRGARGVGIDIDPERIREGEKNAALAKVADRVRFRQADLFTVDLGEATVVTLYLLPSLNLRLRPKLFAELRPGTRIVSNSFDMDDWSADSTLEVERTDGGQVILHYWVLPADSRGSWELSLGGGAEARRYALELDQAYQMLSGRATPRTGGPADVEGRLLGDHVRLKLPGEGGAPLWLEGRVRGDSMEGTVAGGSAGERWSAWRTERPSGPLVAPEPEAGSD